jgi:adenylate cyclase class 2
MTLEIEAKAKVESLEELERRIIKMGGVFRKEVVENDLYFNHPSRDFANTDEALRLRSVESKCYLTYKGPKIDKLTKTREELNVEVGDWDGAIRIFEVLGFVEVLPIKKKRRYLSLADFDVMLDMVEGLGSFIEVEKRGDYNPKELIDFLEELGINDSETRSYLELKLEKSKKRLIT